MDCATRAIARTIRREQRRQHLERLKALRCACGRNKRRGSLFCRRCWRTLRADTRKALSSAELGQAGAVYELALAELEAAGRIEGEPNV